MADNVKHNVCVFDNPFIYFTYWVACVNFKRKRWW